MIKLVFCLRRLAGMDRGAFQTYWRDVHAPLVNSHAATLRIRRYVQTHSLPDDRSAALMASRGSGLDPYDGIAELWWDSFGDMMEPAATADGRAAGRALLEDERRFIDLANSPLFFSQEHEVIALDRSR